jgi:hypothetical protein
MQLIPVLLAHKVVWVTGTGTLRPGSVLHPNPLQNYRTRNDKLDRVFPRIFSIYDFAMRRMPLNHRSDRLTWHTEGALGTRNLNLGISESRKAKLKLSIMLKPHQKLPTINNFNFCGCLLLS